MNVYVYPSLLESIDQPEKRQGNIVVNGIDLVIHTQSGGMTMEVDNGHNI